MDDERPAVGLRSSWEVDVTPAILEAIRQRHAVAVGERAAVGSWGQSHPVPDWAEVEAWCREVLPSPGPPGRGGPGRWDGWWPMDLGDAARVLPLAAVLKLVVGLPGRAQTTWTLQRHVGELHEATQGPDLLTLAAALADMGHGPQRVAEMATAGAEAWALTWPEDHLSPFVRAHLDVVVALLGSADDLGSHLRGALRLIGLLHPIPDGALSAVLDVALGSQAWRRCRAQQMLATHPEAHGALLAAIAHRSADVRIAAAGWAATRPPWLDADATVAALEAAFARERSEPARIAELEALEALGRPAARYLDRGQLAAQARKGLAKGTPAALAWLDLAALPPLSWADTGEAVETDVLTWLLVQAVKAKSPEPNAILRRWCELWDPTQRRAFADALLRGWLAHDQRRASPAEAQVKALAQAREAYGWASQGMFDVHDEIGYIGNLTVEQIAERLLPRRIGRQFLSAVDSKGVLAVVAACADERVVGEVERYAAQWFGYRAPQVKALLGMLAWVEAPAAVQYVLSVGRRFRTRGIQEEAARLIQELAERKGWTIDELADRTLGTAGLDDDGRLVLDYGPRRFIATLTPALTLQLHDEAGKPLPSPPEARKSDDADLAAAAKKQWRATKKQLATMVKEQTARLYEAMCLQRRWRAADWVTYLLPHPVVGPLVSRLLWAEVEDADADLPGSLPRLRRVVRPLGDGSVVDLDDETVTLPEDARLVVVHDLLLDDADRAACATHLLDYAVSPLFGQVAGDPFTLPEARRGARELDEVRGHAMGGFALRTAATRRGYVRGPAEDGGHFYRYVRSFPAGGFEVHLDFSGTHPTQPDGRVALHRVRFVRSGPDGVRRGADAVPLGEVPPVLLAEVHRDATGIAGAGTGYDPQWESIQP